MGPHSTSLAMNMLYTADSMKNMYGSDWGSCLGRLNRAPFNLPGHEHDACQQHVSSVLTTHWLTWINVWFWMGILAGAVEWGWVSQGKFSICLDNSHFFPRIWRANWAGSTVTCIYAPGQSVFVLGRPKLGHFDLHLLFSLFSACVLPYWAQWT